MPTKKPDNKKKKKVTKKPTKKPTKKLPKKVLGTGLAGKAGKHLTERQKKLKAAMKKAGIR